MASFPTVKLVGGDNVVRAAQNMPAGVRSQLRGLLPQLLRKLGASVESKLNSELKSRTNLKVDKLIREDRSGVYGQVTIRWTGDSTKALVPTVLETGAKAHAIVPRNAPVLAFLWPKMGPGMFFFKKVWHPGYPGNHILKRSYDEMAPEIEYAIANSFYWGGIYAGGGTGPSSPTSSQVK